MSIEIEEAINHWLEINGITIPVRDYQFFRPFEWTFNCAWPESRVALYVTPLICDNMELNYATVLGWRLMFCRKRDLMNPDFCRLLKSAIESTHVSWDGEDKDNECKSTKTRN